MHLQGVEIDMEEILLSNDPKRGVIFLGRINRYTSGISETKECQGCQHLKPVASTKKTGYRLSEDHLKNIVGACTEGVGWKIVYRSEKPKKCVKLSPGFAPWRKKN